jgi:dTDP-4-amino-4,6-dideoxygalactose transaminase
VSEFPVYQVEPPPLDQVLKYLELSWKAGQFTNGGPAVRLLEERIADHLSLPKESVVAVSNATLAIQGALETCEPQSSPWSVPSWTFPATYLAAHHSGQRYEIVDVDNFGRLSEPEGTQPCLEVWPFGMGESSWSFTGGRLKVIDAAASFDALQGVGTRLQDTTAVTLSLHATKALAGTEGGIFFSTNLDWVERMRKWINFGFPPGARAPLIIGTNAKMSDSDAAIALASLDNWPTTRAKWRSLYSELTGFLGDLGHRVPIGLREPRATNYLILESKNIESDELSLSALGLETRRWWTPANTLSLKLPTGPNSDYPNTNRLFSSWLGLPFFLSMDVESWKAKITKFTKN